MKTKTKIIIGGVLAIGAYFLWSRNKNKKIVIPTSLPNESNNLDLPTGMDLPNLTPSTDLPTEKAIKGSLFITKPNVDPLDQQEKLLEQKRLDEQARLSVLEKAKLDENERLARLAQEQYAKELAEYERQALLEKQRLDKIRLAQLEQERLDEQARLAEQSRLKNLQLILNQRELEEIAKDSCYNSDIRLGIPYSQCVKQRDINVRSTKPITKPIGGWLVRDDVVMY